MVVEPRGQVPEDGGQEGKTGARVRSAVPLGIPATLQDALMARLDRLGTAKEVATRGGGGTPTNLRLIERNLTAHRGSAAARVD